MNDQNMTYVYTYTENDDNMASFDTIMYLFDR